MELWMAWVPAHRGVEPNEAADAAANMARVQGVHTTCVLPTATYYGAQREAQRQGWRHEWAVGHNGRHLWGLQEVPPQKPWFEAVKARRPLICSMIRLRIGHAPTPAHLHRCAGAPNALCTRCGADGAGAAHLVDDCEFTGKMEFNEEMEKIGLEPQLAVMLKHPGEALEALKALLKANPHLRL